MFTKILKTFIPHSIRKALRICYCRIEMISAHIKYHLIGIKIESPKEIPIIINNYNRLEYLIRLIKSLEQRGYNNIHIIDNASTYPPLLEWYDKTNYNVIKLNNNLGYKALWKSNVYNRFKRSFYIYTDADIEIDTQCPNDFVAYLINEMNKNFFLQKIGLGLRIDNLPMYYNKRNQVIEWEQQWWNKPVSSTLYNAQVDTTFALYRPFCKGTANDAQVQYRTGFPYVSCHLPWYVNSKNLSNEERFYQNLYENNKKLNKGDVITTHWYKK